MTDESIDVAVSAALEARTKGDVQGMNQAFARAKEVSESKYPEGVEPSPVPSSAGTVESRVSAELVDGISEILSAGGDVGVGMIGPALVDDVGFALSFAESFEKSNPKLSEEIAELASSNARIYAMVMRFAALQGRQMAAPAPAPASPQRVNPDRSYRPEPPVAILSHREAIEADIDALLAQTPPGSLGYTDRKFQAKLQSLYAQLDDGAGIVGRGTRWC